MKFEESTEFSDFKETKLDVRGQFGEDARPRAPRGCATTQNVYFRPRYNARSASLAIRQLPDEDAIPPGRGGVRTIQERIVARVFDG